MRKYFLYEFKKNLWTLVLIAVSLTLIYVSTLSTLNMTYSYETERGLNVYVASPQLSLLGGLMICLCFVAPVWTFSFKMNKRGVDAFYALPLKKEKLYFAKAAVGLLLVVIPFTVAYWLGFLTLLVREGNPYQMIWYLPAYFGELLFAVCLFGINTFLFTRANRVGDGIAFMFGYVLLGYLCVIVFDELFGGNYYSWETECFLTFGGQLRFEYNLEYLIKGTQNEGRWSAWIFVYPIVLAAISYCLLFYNLRFERGENAEQVSDSWFGYRLLIPAYLALLSSMIGEELIALCLIFIGGVTAAIVYRRKAKFSWKYWLMIAVGIAIGLALGMLGK